MFGGLDRKFGHIYIVVSASADEPRFQTQNHPSLHQEKSQQVTSHVGFQSKFILTVIFETKRCPSAPVVDYFGVIWDEYLPVSVYLYLLTVVKSWVNIL